MSINNPFMSELTGHLEIYARNRGYTLMVCNSSYDYDLQKEVFDKLGKGETIDLTKLDLNAFELCHTAMMWSGDHYRSMEQGWQKGFNKMLKLIQASAREKRTFF